MLLMLIILKNSDKICSILKGIYQFKAKESIDNIEKESVKPKMYMENEKPVVRKIYSKKG